MVSPVEVITLLILPVYLLPLVAFCRIVQKLGWHWAMGLLMIIPLVNVVMICVFAWGNPPSRNPAVMR